MQVFAGLKAHAPTQKKLQNLLKVHMMTTTWSLSDDSSMVASFRHCQSPMAQGYCAADGGHLRALSKLTKPELLAMCKKLTLCGRGKLLDLDYNIIRSAAGVGSCCYGIQRHAECALGNERLICWLCAVSVCIGRCTCSVHPA